MKSQDLQNQTIEELQATSQELKRKLFDLKNAFHFQKKRDKPHELKHARKDRARVLTILTKKINESKN